MILETYTTLKGRDLVLPDFLEIEKEVTGNPLYSMYNLSLKDPVTSSVEPVAVTNHQSVKLTNGVDSCGDHPRGASNGHDH
jgi:hypothetical protein